MNFDGRKIPLTFEKKMYRSKFPWSVSKNQSHLRIPFDLTEFRSRVSRVPRPNPLDTSKHVLHTSRKPGTFRKRRRKRNKGRKICGNDRGLRLTGNLAKFTRLTYTLREVNLAARPGGPPSRPYFAGGATWVPVGPVVR